MFPIDIRAYKDTENIPLLILVDLQQEYICQGRPLGLENATAAIANCRRLLSCARQCKFPVAFVRWVQKEKVFRKEGQFSAWLEGCQPSGSDMVFERDWPSCYASEEFQHMMSNGGGKNAVIAGFTGAIACLATVLEGVPYGHQFTFIHDASVSHRHGDKNDVEMHSNATSLISLFAAIACTDEWLIAQKIRTERRIRAAHAIG